MCERSLIVSPKDIRIIGFDFDGVFTDNRVFVDSEGNEYVSCWRSDGIGITQLKNEGIHTVVISSEVNPVVGHRCKKLGLNFVQGISDKKAVMADICNELSIDSNNAAFMGNDVNDLSVLRWVGFGICVEDCYSDLLSVCKYRTQKKGGYGAVREVCDLILEAKHHD